MGQHLRVVRGVLASLLLLACSSLARAEEGKLPDVKKTIIASTFSSELIDHRQQALTHQPLLTAYRASVEAAQEKARSLEDLGIAGRFRRDLCIRQQQAKLGVLANMAQLRQAEWTVMYNVTRNYLSAIYARDQLKVAEQVLSEDADSLPSVPYLRELGKEIYKNSTRPDVKDWDIAWIEAFISIGKGRKQEPEQGIQRALAALREAIGLDSSHRITIDPAITLPKIDPVVSRDQIVKLAQQRRGELMQAYVASEVTRLEVDAQGKSSRLVAQTFAAGSDIHATPIPQGHRGLEYVPGAVGIEMPIQLVGKQASRVRQAQLLHERACAARIKAHRLITLEAESAHYKWLTAHNKVKEIGEALKTAQKKYLEVVNDQFAIADPKGSRPTFNDVLEASTRVTYLRLESNQARYQLLLALASLERVTAGGFTAGFEHVAPKKTDK